MRPARRPLQRPRPTGDDEEAAAIDDFYDEYFAVLDMPAEFYLETVDAVFQRDLLPRGQFEWRGQPVDPGAITADRAAHRRGRARTTSAGSARPWPPTTCAPRMQAGPASATTSRPASATTACSAGAVGSARSTRSCGTSSWPTNAAGPARDRGSQNSISSSSSVVGLRLRRLEPLDHVGQSPASSST